MDIIKEQTIKTRNKLISFIPIFHGVFARTKDTMALDIARQLGEVIKAIK